MNPIMLQMGRRVLQFALFSVCLFLLAGCAALGLNTPTPLPTIVLGGDSVPVATSSVTPVPTGNGGVTASALVVPAQEVHLVFAAGGKVESMAALLGDAVEAGQVLAVLDSGTAQLAVQQAQADVSAAQANHELALSAGAARRDANIAAATLALAQAQNALTLLQQNAPLEAARAQSALAEAQSALTEAQRDRTNLDYPRANQTTIDGARAYYELMEDELTKAKEAYDGVKDLAASDPRRAKGLLDLSNAQRERDKALITLNWYLGKNSDQDLAEADAQLTLAQAQVAAAELRWAEVKDGPAAADLALAEANLASAQAQLALAQAPSMEVQLAQAQLDTARVRLQLAENQLAEMTLRAPFAGVVAAVYFDPGEWVMAGQPVLVLVDVSRFRVVTTDLSERDAPRVQVGQEVTVLIKALNQEVTGHVSAISPLADTLGGDVVYQTTIELDEFPQGLRAGMSVEVHYR